MISLRQIARKDKIQRSLFTSRELSRRYTKLQKLYCNSTGYMPVTAIHNGKEYKRIILSEDNAKRHELISRKITQKYCVYTTTKRSFSSGSHKEEPDYLAEENQELIIEKKTEYQGNLNTLVDRHERLDLAIKHAKNLEELD